MDAWVWAIRLYSTRSAATAACKAGHVKVNGASAKPAQGVRVGDTVRALTPGGERLVEVAGIITKRTSASLAAVHYVDRTPPPPPRVERPAAIRARTRGGAPDEARPAVLDRAGYAGEIAHPRPTTSDYEGARYRSSESRGGAKSWSPRRAGRAPPLAENGTSITRDTPPRVDDARHREGYTAHYRDSR